MNLSISSDILDRLQTQARHGAPLEICGLLYGDGETVTAFQQTDNVAAKAHKHFEINPAALIAAERTARDGGPAVLGYYHSHPTGDILPSQTDAKTAAADGKIWLIINGKNAAAWHAVEGGEIFDRFNPVALTQRP